MPPMTGWSIELAACKTLGKKAVFVGRSQLFPPKRTSRTRLHRALSLPCKKNHRYDFKTPRRAPALSAQNSLLRQTLDDAVDACDRCDANSSP